VPLTAPDRPGGHGPDVDEVPPRLPARAAGPARADARGNQQAGTRPLDRGRKGHRVAWPTGRGLAPLGTGDLPGRDHPGREKLAKVPWSPGEPLMVLVGDDHLAVVELDLVAGTAVHHLGRGDDPGGLTVGAEQLVADADLAHRRPASRSRQRG